MKITRARSAGFCFGVRRAINISLATAKLKNPIYMLGDIVHNENVVKEIEKNGIRKIKRLSKGKGKTLLIRAHGTSRKVLRKAKALGYKIVDATCPMVKEIHKIAKSLENNGRQVIIVGDKRHDEVRGIIGQLSSKAIVIDRPEKINLAAIKRIKRAGVIVQSTQNLENVLKIVALLKTQVKDLDFRNTICQPTKTKQDEMKSMPLENDLMIIIGSRASANTKRIYEISKSLNKNSYWVNSAGEINKNWLAEAKSIGVTAGASTPESTIQEVIQKIKTISC
ncbi:MAG: 4-hydroxy-3-methylbut-2-enyl diphosphate reductase [Candidatus Omnitrophota bacterium]